MNATAKILVVDDEDRNLRLMEALLVPLGHSVILAKDGEEALQKVEADGPDLILLDVAMPGMDGFQVAKKVKSNVKTSIIPIVMVTALKEVADRVKALEAGVDDFLNKPVDKTEVRSRVKSLLKVKAYNDHCLKYQKELEEEVARQTFQLKKAVETKELLDSQLRQAQKMESLGALAGGIAHDFNNILSVIIGNANILELSNVMAADDMPCVKQILAAGERAKQLVKQILTFSRRGDHQKLLIDLKPVVNETFSFLKSTLPRSIEVCQNVHADAGTVLADPTQMQQVLMNLCTNAAHAMDKQESGVLEIALEKTFLTEEAARFHPDIGYGEFAKMTVKDNGTGIDPSVLERIFEPYFTTKEPGKGTGLGLSVVHGIVKAHGGFIEINSEPGKGACFHVFLPVASESHSKIV